jgi:hypothetical protein
MSFFPEATDVVDPLSIIAFIVVSTLSVCLRVGSRLKSRKQRWILVALFGVGIGAVVLLVAAHWSSQKHLLGDVSLKRPFVGQLN